MLTHFKKLDLRVTLLLSKTSKESEHTIEVAIERARATGTITECQYDYLIGRLLYGLP